MRMQRIKYKTPYMKTNIYGLEVIKMIQRKLGIASEKTEEILLKRDAGIWNLQTPLQETKPS